MGLVPGMQPRCTYIKRSQEPDPTGSSDGVSWSSGLFGQAHPDPDLRPGRVQVQQLRPPSALQQVTEAGAATEMLIQRWVRPRPDLWCQILLADPSRSVRISPAQHEWSKETSTQVRWVWRSPALPQWHLHFPQAFGGQPGLAAASQTWSCAPWARREVGGCA